MDLVNRIVFVIGLGISRLLEPAMGPLDQFNFFLRQQLASLHVPYDWQGGVIMAGWAIVLFMVMRALQGFLRIAFILLAAVVLAKVYGVLPPP
jgi:hypothetical protein